MNEQLLQWVLIILFGIIFFWISPFAKTVLGFYSASSKEGRSPSVVMLTTSLVISWIFAKSITNAANLGLEFGFVGGISYAVYYLSFLIAGIVLYQLRVKGGFQSIHKFLLHKYGSTALWIFSILISFRLFNEVWSNTMVIGSYFGSIGSTDYYLSIIVFTFLTLAYSLKGGLRSSLLTDAIQMVFFAILIIILLFIILPSGEETSLDYISSGQWTLATGLNLFFVALIQIFSYPFHDPVMTDRGFISDPKTTLHSFLWAGAIGFVCLSLFSWVGIFAMFNQMEGQAPVIVARSLGLLPMLLMNFIMVTSAASTLDSAFSSFSKLAVIDLKLFKQVSISKGRLTMIAVALAGTLPILFSPEILSATTVSGTMVIGLAPVFICWKLKTNKWSFILPVSIGIIIGILLILDCIPNKLLLSQGRYAHLMAANFWGTILCFVVFFITILRSNR